MISWPGRSRAEPSAQGLNKRWVPRKPLLLLLGIFLLFQSAARAQIREVRRVLIINDIGTISSPGFAEIDQALFTGLQKSPYRIELYEESLDLVLFPGRVSQDRFREEIIQKYSARKPDVIIAAGPESLKFIATLYDKFQGTPIVFCTIWSGIPDQLRRGMPFTGVLAQLRPEGTLNVALHLLPNTKHVVIVGGVGKFDQGWEAIAKQSFHNHESKLEFTYLFDLTMPALLERLKHLPSDTIVYHTAISQDAAGDHFIDSDQSIPMVASAANAPVFVMDDVDLRAGTVGGDLVNWADDARIAAEIAVRVLNGEKPQDIPVVTSNHAYMFDWRALKRWGLKESNLPPESIVLNRELTVWESYKSYFIGGILLVLVETLLILGLVWQRARRRTAETQLARAFDALRESERRFRLVSNTAPVLIWMSGPDKLFNYFNQPWLEFTGRALEAELGNGWSEGVHPEDLKNCLDIYTRAFDLRESFKMQYRLRRHDGEYRWVLDIGVPRLNPDGLFAGYIGSCIDVTEGKLAEEALAGVGRRLIEAHEEERTWIARELHDDINQRIALLAIQLDQLDNHPSNSGVEVPDIRKIRQQLSDLGEDIQALSHRLHSSKLEYLGIVSAASGFCKELSEQQKVEINFSHSGIPHSVPKEISLCLFRVLQEALTNAVKHSGERHFRVELHGTSSEIQLTVSDLGVGFDQQVAVDRCGIGLVSMRERLQLVGGEFFVNSKPGGGTTIRALVPHLAEKHRATAAG
jgi:PAS domain S-box-containing protein